MKRLPGLWIVLAFTSIVHAADLPRYQLPVGRQLTYSGGMISKETLGATSISHTDSRFTVVSQNSDGTARVLIRESNQYGESDQPHVTYGYADVFPDGRYKPNPSIGPGMAMDFLLPKLPADDAEAKSQWQSHVDFKGETITYQPVKDSDSAFTFSATYDGPINHIYASTHKVTFQFDRARGMVTESDTRASQDFGFHSKSTGSMKLVKDEMLDPTQAAQFSKDGVAFCTAYEQYMDCLRKISDDPASAQKYCDEAQAILKQAEASVTTDDVRTEFDQLLKRHDEYAKHAVEDANKDMEVLNKPSKVWVATDLDGKKWSLDDLRGKVVVMDFWYRGCGWCMYATPQVKQLAEDYKNKNVVVLGMNTDENESDARFVVKEFGLTYPQLRAKDVPPLYNIHAFPTLLIIDQQGILRTMHVGYSATLHDDVAKKIDGLLNDPQNGWRCRRRGYRKSHMRLP